MPRPIALNRALSKLGLLSRAQATDAVRAGRVRINGAIVTRPLAPVDPTRARIEIDGAVRQRAAWRTVLLHKPRGVVTTRRDPQGRPTVFDVLGSARTGLVAVGRLDMATSGVLLLTSDTALAHWMTDPANGVPRVYTVTVRGKVSVEDVDHLRTGIVSGRDRVRAREVTLRKASGRESHLVVELDEGKNREVRRLFDAIGHEVTRLKRVQLGPLDLGTLQPGQWRELTRADIARAFPEFPREDGSLRVERVNRKSAI